MEFAPENELWQRNTDLLRPKRKNTQNKDRTHSLIKSDFIL